MSAFDAVPPLANGRRLVLGSMSPFRRQLLLKLGLPFAVHAPHIDEQPQPGETAMALVARLAREKAAAVGAQYADALVIGSDQVAVIDDQILGKPGNHDRAVAQLTACSGRAVQFFTGLCVLDTATGAIHAGVVPFTVHFRSLTAAEIDSYLRREQPYNAAGSFKSEGLGIALFARLEGDDPNALVGLPLILLTQLLAAAGVSVLTDPAAT